MSAAASTPWGAAKTALEFLGIADDEPIELRGLTGKKITAVIATAGEIANGKIATPPNEEGIYLVTGRITAQAATLSHRGQQWHRFPANTIADADVTHRRAIMVDCDPQRRKGTSATDEERAHARRLYDLVRTDLLMAGAPESALADVSSGNGYQVWIALAAIESTEDVTGLVRRILDALGTHDTDHAKIDRSVHNPARLFPLPGTMKRKGCGTEERPHRPVTITAPSDPHRLSLDELRALVDRIAPAEPKTEKNSPEPREGTLFSRANAVPIRDVLDWRGLRDGDSYRCVGCGEVSGTAVRDERNGYKCSHNRCADKGVPGYSGWRTPVDIVAESAGVGAIEAAHMIEQRYLRAATAANDGAKTTSPIVALLSAEDLFAPQDDASWLVPDLGIAPGAPTMLVGQGYVGKTLAAMSLGISVATGRNVWGRFPTARRGRVLHLDYEQGRRVTSKRFRRLVLGVGADLADIRDRWGAMILPRVNLTSLNAGDELCRLFDGWDLVILDSLKAMTPGVEENSSAMRDYMHVLTEASERTGAVPLVIHHAGKSPPQGSRPRKEMGRGSSGIYDEAQSYFVMTGEKGQPVLVSHEKDRERGETVPDFTLSILDRADGALIVSSDERTPAVAATSQRAEVEAAKRKIVEALRESEPGLAKSALRTHVGKAMTIIDAALTELEDAGIIEHNGAKARFARYLISKQRKAA